MTITLEGDRVAPPPSWGALSSGWGPRLWRLVVRLGGTWAGVRVRRYPSVAIGFGAFLIYAVTSLVRFARMYAGIDLAIFTQAVQQTRMRRATCRGPTSRPPEDSTCSGTTSPRSWRSWPRSTGSGPTHGCC